MDKKEPAADIQLPEEKTPGWPHFMAGGKLIGTISMSSFMVALLSDEQKAKIIAECEARFSDEAYGHCAAVIERVTIDYLLDRSIVSEELLIAAITTAVETGEAEESS